MIAFQIYNSHLKHIYSCMYFLHLIVYTYLFLTWVCYMVNTCTCIISFLLTANTDAESESETISTASDVESAASGPGGNEVDVNTRGSSLDSFHRCFPPNKTSRRKEVQSDDDLLSHLLSNTSIDHDSDSDPAGKKKHWCRSLPTRRHIFHGKKYLKVSICILVSMTIIYI